MKAKNDMRRFTILTFAMALLLTFSVGCKQTQEDRYQRYLEEVADTSSSTMEFITPEADPEAPPVDDDGDPFAGDVGIYTIPETPKERKVDMNANNYEVEKMMSGKE